MTNLKSANIVVFGAINMDLIGLSTRLPLPGETVQGESFYTSPGGKGDPLRYGSDIRRDAREYGWAWAKDPRSPN